VGHELAGNVISVTKHFEAAQLASALSIPATQKELCRYERLSGFAGVGEASFIDSGFLPGDGHVPKAETYGLTIQIRRCAASSAANIAEGCGKRETESFSGS
jgi:hypothetical protein